MSAVNLEGKDFDQIIQDEKVVLVDFWATWCGPCRMVGPVIDKVAAKYKGKAVVAKVNVDEEQALAAKYNIMSIPTVLVFKNGEKVQEEVGAHPQGFYEEMIERNL